MNQTRIRTRCMEPLELVSNAPCSPAINHATVTPAAPVQVPRTHSRLPTPIAPCSTQSKSNPAVTPSKSLNSGMANKVGTNPRGLTCLPLCPHSASNRHHHHRWWHRATTATSCPSRHGLGPSIAHARPVPGVLSQAANPRGNFYANPDTYIAQFLLVVAFAPETFADWRVIKEVGESGTTVRVQTGHEVGAGVAA